MTADITIVGLGPGPAEFRTMAAQRAIDSATRIFVRSHDDFELSDLHHHPNVTDLGPLRDQHAHTSSDRWQTATDAVIAAARRQPVVLAIPGHPRFGEGLVRLTLETAAESGLSTEIIDGISAVDLLASAADIDPILDEAQFITARSLQALEDSQPWDGGRLHLTPLRPVFVTHAYDSRLMAASQQQLLRIFPACHPVQIIQAAGHASETKATTTLSALDAAAGGPLVALYLPALGPLDATRDARTLQHIVARLRKDDGCPWDRKQTTQSLRGPLIDELYEVIDAIDAADDENLCEELGDLLLLTMMHAQIATERGAFRLEDVYDAISTKIVRRHPHVFGDLAETNADEVVGLWQQVKAQEKREKPQKPEKAEDGQPHSMPALERAARVLKKYPLPTIESTAQQRSDDLIRALSAVIGSGEDPETVIKQALINHVQCAKTGAEYGDKNATN